MMGKITHLELLVLRRLDGSVRRQLLDDLDGLVESGLNGHVERVLWGMRVQWV
jgi:hypothetical protein